MRLRPHVLLLLTLTLGLSTAALCASFETQVASAAKKRPKRKAKPVKKKSRATRGRPARGPTQPLPPIQRTPLYGSCAAEMVNVQGRFCIDRWEASTVDADSGMPLSPYYPPTPRLAKVIHEHWQGEVVAELQQARTHMLEAGATPPSDFGQPDGDGGFPTAFRPTVTPAPPVLIAVPARRVADAGAQEDASVAEDPDASSMLSLAPTEAAPYGFVLLGDAGDDARARPVMLLPVLPPWQVGAPFRPKAVSRPHVVPQGYVPGFVAEQACREAGKRLCREQEWVLACKGSRGFKHPYGAEYQQGRCNVFRQEHPGRLLHGNCSIGLSDPRLNMMAHEGEPLLHMTGETPSCVSAWDDDAIFDMVGNVDEWVDDPSGVFVGGFYARNTRNGCEARVGSHPPVYFDYSTGFRCCADLASAPR